jgi:diguanylate cyclase (GGDEF)-like protein/PAS domain S-box-containing protein
MSQITPSSAPASDGSLLVETILSDYQELHQEQHRLAAIVDALDDAILSKNLDGVITTWNAAAERMFGYTAAEVIGLSPAMFYPPGRQQAEAHLSDRLRQGIVTTNFETVRLHKNGTPVYLSTTISPIKNAAGQVLGSFIIAKNITEGKRIQDALAQSEQWLQSALCAGRMGLWELDLRLQRVCWSAETACLLGFPPDTLEVSFEEYGAIVHPEDRANLWQAVDDTVANRTFVEHDYRCIWPNGEVRWMQAQGRAVYDSEERPLLMMGTLMDITERKALLQAELKAQDAVEEQARVLEMIARGEPLERLLDAVVRLIEAQLPHALCSVLRLEGNTLRDGAAPRLPEAYTRAIDGLIIGEGVGSCGTAAYRKEPVIVTDIATDPLWADFSALALAHDLRACWSWPVLAQDGTVLGTFAIYHNTPHCPAETEFACVRQATNLVGIALERHRREERFALAMEGARDGLWDWNIGTGEVYFSPRYKAMVGYAEDEFHDHVDNWIAHVHPDDLPHVQATLAAYFERRLDTCEVEFRMRHKGGSYRWILARGVALFNEAGQPYRMAGSHTDITEKKQAEHQLKAVNSGLSDVNAELEQQKAALEAANTHLEALATTDGLTRLKNHGTFQDRLREEYMRAARYHAPLSVVLLDVDKFKQFNDTHGHPAGDTVLKQVADILQREARTTDIVARYGGEEFVVILPESDAESARQVAERMREAIAAAAWEKDSVTASFGIATLTLLTPNPAALVTESDKALYRSKHQGRNCVTHFTDPPQPALADS